MNEDLKNFKEALSTEMRCGVLSNKHGEILIIYDKPIQSKIQWIEYRPENEEFFLIHENGTPQELGLTFDSKMKENLQHGIEVILAHVIDGKFQSTYKTSLIIQDY